MSVSASIVVDNDFNSLWVSFSRKKYCCTGIFEHWNKKWKYITLSIKVLYSLKDSCTLLFPASQFGFVIKAVTLP